MPQDYELIATMWYLARNEEDELTSNIIYYSRKNPENGSSDSSVLSLTTGPTNPLGAWACMGNEFSISFNVSRINPVNSNISCITKQYYKSQVLISVPNGEVSGIEYHYQNGDSINFNVNTITYNVSSGSGIFENAKIIQITTDNDGTLFGKKWSRRVEVFKLKPKQTEENPPDFSGIFEREIYLYGYLSKDIKIPIEQPLKFDQTIEVKQVNNFVEITPINYPPGFPERSPLPGVLEPTYTNDLQFMGWKVVAVNTVNNNALFVIYPTKIENNSVMEFKEVSYQSGFNKGNPEQSPLVGYSTAKRIYIDQTDGYDVP
jgi:hypothetical protein